LSGIRPTPKAWLADHVVFFVYRWLAWALAVLPWFLWAPSSAYGWVLLATGLLNILATLFAQKYIRVARRTPALMVLDIFSLVLVLHLVRTSPGGFDNGGLFVPYAYGSLVLPSLLFGWRGGIMAGLAFVTLDRAALWSVNMPAADMTTRAWVNLALMMIVPPIFGSVFPLLIDLLRWAMARREQSYTQRRVPIAGANPRRDLPADTMRFTALNRDADRRRPDERPQEPLALQATRVRAVEPSVEDLRRVLFAPLPAPDLAFPELLELLTVRFGQHTGAATRVVTLGRARQLAPGHRSVLVRLMQEALLNVQQHAHAGGVVLTLRYDASSVALLIQDDGVGLLDGTHERPGLHALRALQYRLAEFSGRLDVFETEGGGVTVRATMPLE